VQTAGLESLDGLGVGAEGDARRRAALRRMKSVAAGLLLVAAVLYLATLGLAHDDESGLSWASWVNAGAEAAMVGALADWFAVTALFRHPLGLPIPHTALIPNRKDALGESLEEFVSANFLSVDVVRDKVARAQPAARVGEWLAVPGRAEMITARVADGAARGLAALRDEDVAAILDHSVVQGALAREWSEPAGHLLERIVQDGAHHRLFDVAANRLRVWLEQNPERVIGLVRERAPVWTPSWVDDKIAKRLQKEILRLVTEIEEDPDHAARKALDDLLLRFAGDLQRDAPTKERVEAIVRRTLEQDDVRAAMTRMWTTARELLVESLADEAGELRRRIATEIARFGERLRSDDALRASVDARLVEGAGFVVGAYGRELTSVISDTVQRWDGRDAARRIELHVGRDLQFIRINGTVVGALAGLGIHAVTVAVR
jgi:uncharacterized membrane-anchored protein YjiN (DUF445 family)